MQYFFASILTLLGLVNSLQCADVNGGHNTLPSGPRVRLEVHPRIEEWPYSAPGKKLILRKKNEPLNLTCTVAYQNGEKDDDSPFDYIVDWKGPRHINNNPKIERGQSKNTAWIWFKRLGENDAGDYTCMAISQKPWDLSLSVFFYLFVEHKPTYCGSQWFRCHSKNCIMERYVCDGKRDCEEGEDESPAAGCGLNPCLGKVLCEDRCIPADWCCDHRNCSSTFGLRPWPHENHEISYVQTAFYTVIGCAMAFMFIVTILVIAICRVQIKRAMNSRCSQPNRNVIRCGRRVGLYDLDVYLNRTADVNYPGGVSIMYNINSDVQFVGRPTEPPPYSEVIAEPPREGPPPPYVSCENLIVHVANPRFVENTEAIQSQNDLASNFPLNRNVAESTDVNPSDTDIRNGTNVSGRENSALSMPGPQVPTYSCLPLSHTMVNRDSDPMNFSRTTNSLQSRDSVDSTVPLSNLPSVQPNFELEYVETDALLVDNPYGKSERNSSDPIVGFAPCRRPGIATSLWMNIERRNKRADKNRYRESIDKTIKECPVRETSSHKDSENEGVFLDTDQQDLTPVESISGGNGTSNGFPAFPSVVDATVTPETSTTTMRKRDEENVPGCSSSSGSSDTTSGLAIIENDRRESESTERRENDETSGETRKKKTEMKYSCDKKVKNETEPLEKKSSTTRNFLRGMKRQTSLANEEMGSKNLGESSICTSTRSVDLPNPRLDDDAANSQIRQSSLVLPLRESFIGVQRDS